MAESSVSLYIVDAFSAAPFAGNPAAVCTLRCDSNLDDGTLQNIAMEMNLSETAFIRPLNASDKEYETGRRFGLRWFTPVSEIKLCGHATLASAAVLFYEIGNTSPSITFETLSGDLIVKKDGDFISMDFPLGKTQKRKVDDYDAVSEAFGHFPGVQDAYWCESLKYLLLRFTDGWTMSQVEGWAPDISKLHKAISDVIVVIATTRGSAEDGYRDAGGRAYDFVSRCFAPWTGVPEDPVTGSAQTVLADYWRQQLNKDEFYTRQCSRRGGEIQIKVDGDRVHMLGKAVVVVRGQLLAH